MTDRSLLPDWFPGDQKKAPRKSLRLKMLMTVSEGRKFPLRFTLSILTLAERRGKPELVEQAKTWVAKHGAPPPATH